MDQKPFDMRPVKPSQSKSRRMAAEDQRAQLVTKYQGRDNRNRRIDPGAGQTGQLVKPEYESNGNRQGSVQSGNRRSETDEYAHGEPRRNMAGVTVQR